MSLTESCVAAAVISTFMAASLPSLNRTVQTYRLGSAASGVAAKLHFTRILAITRNRDCRMTVTSASSFVIECEDGPWRAIERLDVPRGITLEANARPEFHRRGNVSPAATFTLRNAAGAAKRVIVNINGRIRIQ